MTGPQQKSNSPLVSVIMPTQNRAAFLPESVKSILKQTYRHVELLIVDDASTDNTWEVLAGLVRKDSRIKIFQNDVSRGAGHARRKAIKNATGTYIAMMDDDDIALPERLESQVEYLEQNPDTAVVFSQVQVVDGNMKVLRTQPEEAVIRKFPKNPKKIFEYLYLKGNIINHPSVMMRREALEKIGGYPAMPLLSDDRVCYMQMTALGFKIKAMSKPLLLSRRGAGHASLTSSMKRRLQNHIQTYWIIRSWLRKNDIHEFDRLHRRALSKRLINYARYTGGLKGGGIYLWGMAVDPKNPKIKEAFKDLKRKGWGKVVDFFSRSEKMTAEGCKENE